MIIASSCKHAADKLKSIALSIPCTKQINCNSMNHLSVELFQAMTDSRALNFVEDIWQLSLLTLMLEELPAILFMVEP